MKIRISKDARNIYLGQSQMLTNWEWAKTIEKIAGMTLEVETLAPVKPVTKVIDGLEHLFGDVFKPATYKKNLIPIGEQDYIVPDNSFLCRKIRVIGLVD